MKLKKRRKSSRIQSRTHGYSAKLNKGSGNRGGKGMAGTGKRGDQLKSQMINLYGGKYFGRRGITSRKTEKKVNKIINLQEIEEKFKGGEKEVDLKDYKILGRIDRELTKKFIIKAKAASKSAIEKIEKAGGKIILPVVKKREVKKKAEKSSLEKISEKTAKAEEENTEEETEEEEE